MSENLVGLLDDIVDTSLYVKSCLWVVWTVSSLIGKSGTSLGFDFIGQWSGISVGGGGVPFLSLSLCRLSLGLSSLDPLFLLALALS